MLRCYPMEFLSSLMEISLCHVVVGRIRVTQSQSHMHFMTFHLHSSTTGRQHSASLSTANNPFTTINTASSSTIIHQHPKPQLLQHTTTLKLCLSALRDVDLHGFTVVLTGCYERHTCRFASLVRVAEVMSSASLYSLFSLPSPDRVGFRPLRFSLSVSLYVVFTCSWPSFTQHPEDET